MTKKLFYSLLLLGIIGCSKSSKPTSEAELPVIDATARAHKPCNSIYYWKTTFRLSENERNFLSDHHIKRLYLRFFDVSVDLSDRKQVSAMPEATLIFNDTIPANLEIIPTVFIDNQLFKDNDAMIWTEKKIVSRIMTMCKTNDVSNIREIQFDCDWTQTTEKAYFDFLERAKMLLKSHKISISATIRLHQLRTKEPPVDRGVLMCYNTGGIRNPETVNSILSASDVAPYSKNIFYYPLPLDVAYPSFSWAVWFKRGKFQALLRELNPDNKNIKCKKYTYFYTVENGFYQEGKYLSEGDEIRFENSDFKEIIDAKKLIEKEMKNYSVILYHLDYNNLSKYSKDEINQIYSR